MTSGAHLAPSWSPDGSKIAFASQDPGNTGILTVTADGSTIERLTNVGGRPAWSLSGTAIAFQTTPDLSGSIDVINTDGTGAVSVVAGAFEPAWLPTSGLSFVRPVQTERGTMAELFVAGKDGSGARSITPGFMATVSRHDWAPDGSRVVFEAGEDGGIARLLYVANADGSGRRALTGGVAGDPNWWDRWPAWSPDGQLIAFVRSNNVTGEGLLMVVRPDGGGERVVTNAVRAWDGIDWLPVADRDGDALLDDWEEFGIDADGDGVIDLDLPAMGADPERKDVFLELDYMDPHRLDDAIVALVVDAFARAPVTNVDGSTGISLHVDNGASSEMDPLTHRRWGSLSRQSDIPHVDALGSTTGGDYDWSAIDALKAAHFETVRHQVFHYGIAAHGLGGSTAAGKSRGNLGGASDFVLSLGRYASGIDTDFGSGAFRANTLMHELGHNLGLGHGGPDSVNHKPNYLSIMNYLFMGLLVRENGTEVLDYSRFEIPLDELALDEPTGFGVPAGSGPAGILTRHRCADGTLVEVVVGDDPIDWDCDGAFASSPVSADTNGDGQTAALATQVDWDHLVFDGGLVGAKAAPQLPKVTPMDEPPIEEIEANARALRDYLAAHGVALPSDTPDDGTGSGPPDGGPASGPGDPLAVALITGLTGLLVVGLAGTWYLRRSRARR